MTQKLALLGGEPVRTQPFSPWPVFGKMEEERLLAVLRGGKWGKLNGSEVAGFEARFASAHGCRHGIGVVNGTVSLRIALLAAGLQAEAEVIVPPYTFFSTASAVVRSAAHSATRASTCSLWATRQSRLLQSGSSARSRRLSAFSTPDHWPGVAAPSTALGTALSGEPITPAHSGPGDQAPAAPSSRRRP